MAGETILVVDDAPVNLKLAAAVLRSEGYKVHLACSAEEALMKLRKRKSSRTVSLDEPTDTGEDTMVREIAVWDENP